MAVSKRFKDIQARLTIRPWTVHVYSPGGRPVKTLHYPYKPSLSEIRKLFFEGKYAHIGQRYGSIIVFIMHVTIKESAIIGGEGVFEEVPA